MEKETNNKEDKYNEQTSDDEKKILKNKFLSNTNYKPFIKCCGFILCALVILAVLYIMYNKFYDNQLSENFIEKTIKSDPADDKSFDKFNVEEEICSLKKKQEDYLIKLSRENNF